ncbi:hypothetical protein AQUCO_02200007v1 [Aquilegia coerulea]|uniref:DUF761 domain-containing protein n=1 Tax=Aquilegia coerulea TaxID=218851 RepID=A0A2G5DDL1_AQUCA|nr:hypothetical protein AQUCO_02200007v1 [Aquilegia coerulea]
MMKTKASVFLKQVMSVITSVIKAKSLAVKSKTSAMKTRLIIFSLLKNKKVLMSTISHKIHVLLGQDDKKDDGDNDHNKAIVLYKSQFNTELVESMRAEEEDEDDKYPDLRHSLFDSDGDEFDDQTGSVIDLVRNAKEEGEDFSLEDEIDHVADLFIRRFHRQIKMQKQESFKRYQDMLERSV